VTLRYLKQYLNQVIVENCQLRSLLDQRNNQLAAMQNTVNEKNRDLELLKRAKEEIERTIERVAQINTNHLRDIERKNRDIQDLQSRMNSIQGN
jgi:chromosome segregation ATPase